MMLMRLATIMVLLCTSAYGKIDISDPRTVGLIYIVPHGREYNQDIVDRFKDDIVLAQHFFASELERHGYGYLEFNVELDKDGEPLVHYIQMQEGETLGRILVDSFNFDGNIFVIVFDEGVFTRGYAVSWYDSLEPEPMSEEGGYVILGSIYGHQTLRHELGHVFRLEHDFKNKESVMSWTAQGDRGADNVLLKCQAASLAMHPYFNHDILLEKTFRYYGGVPGVYSCEELVFEELIYPTFDGIKIDLPDTYTHADESIPVTVEVNNPNGVYHVSLETVVFIDCRHGAGGINETFTFQYDGYQDHDKFYTLDSKRSECEGKDYHILRIKVLDMAGNLYSVPVITYRDETISREDINVDGVINVLDLIIVANHISDKTYAKVADVNVDGVINVLDLVVVSQVR